MFNLLIVDDEQWIRKGIIAKLNNHDLLVSRIYEAESSEEALKFMKNKDIHLIITDIRMAELSGLQLIRKVKEKHDTKFIVISGYAEFDYAKEALELEVSGYLLKPVKEAELVDLIEKVTSELIEQSKFDQEHYILEQKINEYFQGNDVTRDEHLNYEYYSLAIIDVALKWQQNLMDIKMKIMTAFETTESRCDTYVVNNHSDNKQILVLFMSNERSEVHKTRNWYIFNSFHKVKESCAATITVGVSNILERLERKLYEQANDALLNKLISGSDNIYYYKNQNNIISFKDQDIKQLEKYIQCKDIKNIRKFIDEIFSDKNFDEENIVSIKYLFDEITNFIRYRFRNEAHGPIPNVFQDNLYITFFNDLNELKSEIIAYIEDHLHDDIEVGNVKDIIRKARKYVDMHYDDELTIKDLAYKVGINSNYLSTLFKKETGKTFTKYLTDMRIDNAKKLLMDTEANVAQISKSVGYHDPGYFYRVFKKQTGQTPLAYRKTKKV
ncbi:response regulator transcription factor [Vallitalea okinawensis]|uniref:response regulator transcription factor n=1 Tax=Vallitalea okinawensis TaxID=2078660 RepID=UPI000CFBC607|nr:helix-turn-helix domain-containing protein [Vallitalea okinawensis]